MSALGVGGVEAGERQMGSPGVTRDISQEGQNSLGSKSLKLCSLLTLSGPDLVDVSGTLPVEMALKAGCADRADERALCRVSPHRGGGDLGVHPPWCPQGELQVTWRKGNGAAGSTWTLGAKQIVLHQEGEGWPLCSDQLFLYPGAAAETQISHRNKHKQTHNLAAC